MNARPLITSLVTIFVVPMLSLAAAGDYLIEEDGAAGPLPPSLEFHHGAWKFGKGAVIGVQVPAENHMVASCHPRLRREPSLRSYQAGP